MRAFVLSVSPLIFACGLETALFGGVFGERHPPPPDAAIAPSPLMQGSVTGLAGAKVQLVDIAGAAVIETTVLATDTFSVTLSPQTAYRNLRVVARKGQLVLLALAPSVSATTPGQSTPPITSVGTLDDFSTMAALVVLEKLRQSGLALAQTQPSVISQAVTLVKNMANADGPVKTFWRMVVDLKTAADTTKTDFVVFDPSAATSTSYVSFLNQMFLLAKDVDYTRDSVYDKTRDREDTEEDTEKRKGEGGMIDAPRYPILSVKLWCVGHGKEPGWGQPFE